MGNFLAKPAKWRLFNKKETEDDWATKSDWICNDQQCPNPYTHARGDPCKLTMEDLFPSGPEPLTSQGHHSARGRFRRLADRMGQREQGQNQLVSSRKMSNPKTNKRTYTTLNHLLLARNHYITASMYMYKI